MLRGYHRTFWRHAGRFTPLSPDVPDRTLAVDPWEMLAPVAPGVRLMPPGRQTPPEVAGLNLLSAAALTQEGYEGFPGRGPVAPKEEDVMGSPDYGPALMVGV